jgi:hypothetical protein
MQTSNPKSRTIRLVITVITALLLAGVSVAQGITGQKPSCTGSVQGQRFARIEPAGPETRVEASVLIAKKRYRMVALTDTTGAARLYGLPEGITSVRILPFGKAKTLKTSTACSAPNDTGTLSGTFVSALTKVIQNERVAINVGTAVLIVPLGAFKSAIVKISKGSTSLDTTNPTLTGPLIIDAGKAAFLKPLTIEFPVTSTIPVAALFLPAGAAVATELPLTLNRQGTIIRVDVPGPGTVELVQRTPTLPITLDASDRGFGQPGPLELKAAPPQGATRTEAQESASSTTESWGDCRLTFSKKGPNLTANPGKKCPATVSGNVTTLKDGITVIINASPEGTCLTVTPIVLRGTAGVPSLAQQQRWSNGPFVAPPPGVIVGGGPVLAGLFPDAADPFDALDLSFCSLSGEMVFNDSPDRNFTVRW